MSNMEIAIRIFAGVVFVLSNAFFVAIEFALTRLRQFEKDELPDTPGAQKSWELTNELEINLTGCQVGISLTTLLLGVISEPAITTAIMSLFEAFGVSMEAHRWIGLTVAIVMLNLIHKIWGEQAPTYLGVERPLEVCSKLGVPFSWWIRIVYPVIIFGDGLAKWTLGLFGVEVTRSWTQDEGSEDNSGPRSGLREELVSLMRQKGLEKEEQEEVVNALDIISTKVSTIMVPREAINSLKDDQAFLDAIPTISRSSHSRYPLVKDNVDNFIGSLYTPEILANVEKLQSGERTLKDFAHPPLTLPQELTVSDAIDLFQEHREELALVVDKQENTVGLLTLTDALEAIVGPCEDPLDNASPVLERTAS